MTNPQYITDVKLTGAPPGTKTSDLTPGSPGVTFEEQNPTVTIPFPPGITPIVVDISVPNTDTNVQQIRVVITASDGTVTVDQVSPVGRNKVTDLPKTPLPENSTVTITFVTNNNQPPENVTISVIACYAPSTAMTVVTSGTTPPSVSGSSPTVIISSSTTTGAISTFVDDYFVSVHASSFSPDLFSGPGETTATVSVTGGSSTSGAVTSPEATVSTGGSGASTQPTGIVRTISSSYQRYK